MARKPTLPEEPIEDVMERIAGKRQVENPFQPLIDLYEKSSGFRLTAHLAVAGLTVATFSLGIYALTSKVSPSQTPTSPAQAAQPAAATSIPLTLSTPAAPTNPSTFIPYTITWLPGHQASGSPEVVELQPGEVLYLTASRFSVNGVDCGFTNGEVCVYLKQAAAQETFTIDNYTSGETWVQIAQNTTIDEVLAERSPDFWVYPNCGNGCSLARIVEDRPEGTRDSYILSAPQKTPAPAVPAPTTVPAASSHLTWRTQETVGSSSLTVTLNPGEVLYLSGSHWMYNGYACRNENRSDMLCIFTRQANGTETLTIDYLAPNNVWYGIASGATVDEVIQNRLPMWHQPPNCTSGCTLVIVREALTDTTFKDSRYDWNSASSTYTKQ
jgi:hypothetical protein